MIDSVVNGAMAGALGTVALNGVTYLDIAVRGRAPSDLPDQVIGRSARDTGLSLGDEPRASHRRTGLGALFGYATGIGLGATYGLVRSRLGRVSIPMAGTALGAVAMVGANAPAVRMGFTSPRRWGTSGWLADLVPHAAFGLATAAAYERLVAPA
jgi:hypothetical protein